MFQKATKAQSRGRVAILGPSGSGKTYTGLITACTLANGGKVAVIDSERGSASKYADIFAFDVCELSKFDPRDYVKAIKAAEAAGYAAILIDSLTHAWSGVDGALEQVDKEVARSRAGNSFAAWRAVTPMHNALVDAMLQSPCHIVGTMRVKQEYVLEDNGRGKQVPRKVGMAPVQREGMEYEFDVIADMDVGHTLCVSKTRCPQLDQWVAVKPGKEFGETLLAWLSDGVEAKAAPRPAAAPPVTTPPPPAPKPAAKPPAAKAPPSATELCAAKKTPLDIAGWLQRCFDKIPVDSDERWTEIFGAVYARITAEQWTEKQAGILFKKLDEIQHARDQHSLDADVAQAFGADGLAEDVV